MACQAWIRLGCQFEGNRVPLAVPAMQSVPEIECALLRSIHCETGNSFIGANPAPNLHPYSGQKSVRKNIILTKQLTAHGPAPVRWQCPQNDRFLSSDNGKN